MRAAAAAQQTCAFCGWRDATHRAEYEGRQFAACGTCDPPQETYPRVVGPNGQLMIDLTGHEFGRWVVVERVQEVRGREVHWRCRCQDCGRVAVIVGTFLRTSSPRMCSSCIRAVRAVACGRSP